MPVPAVGHDNLSTGLGMPRTAKVERSDYRALLQDSFPEWEALAIGLAEVPGKPADAHVVRVREGEEEEEDAIRHGRNNLRHSVGCGLEDHSWHSRHFGMAVDFAREGLM